jgi:hypothetical protein
VKPLKQISPRAEAPPVIRLAENVPRIFGHGVVGVDEVESLAVQTVEDRMILHHAELVPPDVRDLEVAALEAHHSARDKPQALHPRRLFGGPEDDLQSDADPEEGLARCKRLPTRLFHPAVPQLPHAVPERSYAGKHDRVCGRYYGRVLRKLHHSTDLL